MRLRLKPYQYYKDSGVSWLGSVPVHWSIKPGFSVLREKHIKNIGLVERTVLSLSYGKIVVKPQEKIHGLVPASFETYQIVDPGEIIIRPTDLQNDWNSLRVGIARNRGIITSAYLCLKTVAPIISGYGHLILHAYDLMKIFYGMGLGLRQNLDFGDFKRMPVLIPPEEEQEQIVHYLTHVENRINLLIRTKQRLIKLLNEQKQAIIYSVVTRGLDPNARLKPSGVDLLDDVPEHWRILQLRRLVSFVTSGSRGWASYYSDTGDIFLQSGNLGRSMSLNLSFIQRVQPPKGAEGIRTKIKRDDVLVCVTGAMTGNVALVDVDLDADAYINQHIALVRPKPTMVYPRYLAFVLHSEVGKIQFKTNEYGGTKQGLGLGDVKAIFVPLPPMSEQMAICSELDTHMAGFNEAINRTHREIELIREYHTRLITDVVTGKVDIRDVELPMLDEVNNLDVISDSDNLEAYESEVLEESSYADD